ncbi:MAG TPA: alpha/beta hydrolase family protein [Bryobacteraceae bacterium]|nr:alpha/beta hydrolase family protein [Bryobacteraceae bacterium]
MELLREWYGRRMHAWELDLATRSTDRVVRPFDWGTEWTRNWPVESGAADPETRIRELNHQAIARSHEFFGYRKPADFRFDHAWLRFTSAVDTPYAENNTVHARFFAPSPRFQRGNKAVVVLPHWNASPHQHVALCAGIAKFGIAALRISLPYHDRRMPAELTRADYAVSSNISRTIDATRQAVIDIRSCFDWLEQQGYEDLGIVGTSLGSCYAFLTAAHDERLRVNVFNHCSTRFADVVWTGLSTRHIRQGIENEIDLERLRAAWECISPVHYMDTYAARRNKSFFLYATYDTTFLPEFSKQAVDHVRQRGMKHKLVVMPCGHYTLGESPFKFAVGYHIVSFLKRNL